MTEESTLAWHWLNDAGELALAPAGYVEAAPRRLKVVR